MLQCKPLHIKRDFIVSLQINNLQQIFILYYNNGFLGLYFGEEKCLLTCLYICHVCDSWAVCRVMYTSMPEVDALLSRWGIRDCLELLEEATLSREKITQSVLHSGAWLIEGFLFCTNLVHLLWNLQTLVSKCPLLWHCSRGCPLLHLNFSVLQ